MKAHRRNERRGKMSQNYNYGSFEDDTPYAMYITLLQESEEMYG